MNNDKPRAMRRLALWVELGSEDKNRYVDLVLVSPEFLTQRNTLRIAR